MYVCGHACVCMSVCVLCAAQTPPCSVSPACMCICKYACMHACFSVCMCVCMHVRASLCLCVCACYAPKNMAMLGVYCVYICMYVSMYVRYHACMHEYVHAFMCMCMCVYVRHDSLKNLLPPQWEPRVCVRARAKLMCVHAGYILGGH